jgi:cell division septation protein DedD
VLNLEDQVRNEVKRQRPISTTNNGDDDKDIITLLTALKLEDALRAEAKIHREKLDAVLESEKKGNSEDNTDNEDESDEVLVSIVPVAEQNTNGEDVKLINEVIKQEIENELVAKSIKQEIENELVAKSIKQEIENELAAKSIKLEINKKLYDIITDALKIETPATNEPTEPTEASATNESTESTAAAATNESTESTESTEAPTTNESTESTESTEAPTTNESTEPNDDVWVITIDDEITNGPPMKKGKGIYIYNIHY